MLQGTWHLVGWEIEIAGRVTQPFGADPTGLIHYTADGGMSACIARADRPRWSGGNPRTAPEAERLAAFESYFHYAGTWRIEERAGQTVVVHTVTHSLNPDFVGSEQVRNVDLDGDSLTLSAQEGPRFHRLRWRR
ncbi:MAG: lipocalin-like domain-containing protein [Rhodobacter sp.]|uniref:lipocalin-like domain-containing protein n=1 Tax=Pararhodobacter sp. TaxID=2127056 RepID=UPI001E17F6EE|nr:lipocalin-like domain-containing protein [Pararhodobacter sp.]MCB1345194.1 lipocalin-like domain-containing protein [Paracoccaceae bacterium]MCC0072274.1 lipocalin-like domain-containing protein [Rhodobacter sp.]HPD93161.1 lipocalin-like domain-containing protein [Pararhodobacter sp.]